MLNYLKPAAILLLAMTLLTGVVYPLLVTGFAQVFFADKANGSLITDTHGSALGSSLIGQTFTGDNYFWGRPSATVPDAYNAAASGGSNLGPTNPALKEAVAKRIHALKARDRSNTDPVPVDLVTASASGLDPHISPAAANYQINRVAKARNISVFDLKQLVLQQTEPRFVLLFGEPRVNVLQLNLALDDLQTKTAAHHE